MVAWWLFTVEFLINCCIQECSGDINMVAFKVSNGNFSKEGFDGGVAYYWCKCGGVVNAWSLAVALCN